jgi:hypothetical protein
MVGMNVELIRVESGLCKLVRWSNGAVYVEQSAADDRFRMESENTVEAVEMKARAR